MLHLKCCHLTSVPPPTAPSEMKGMRTWLRSWNHSRCLWRKSIGLGNKNMLTDNELPCQKNRKLSNANCSSASWSTNGSTADKIQVQVQTPQENGGELIFFFEIPSQTKIHRAVKSDSSCQTILNWLILSLLSLACQVSDNIFNIKLAAN